MSDDADSNDWSMYAASETVRELRLAIEAEVLERHGVGAMEEFEHDLRKQIARQIELHRNDRRGPLYPWSVRDAYDHAARIARGGGA